MQWNKVLFLVCAVAFAGCLETPAPPKPPVVLPVFDVLLEPQVNQINVSWQTVADAQSYVVYHQANNGGVNENAVTALEFQITTASVETFNVWVRALKADGEAFKESPKTTVTSLDGSLVLASDSAQ